MDTVLFDREFLRKLESLAFISHRIYRGEARGAHASVRRGTSLDFADYRTYQPGDDFRTIDWGIFGRLDRLFVRLYAEEEDLTVHLLLDSSASMSYGAPPKIDYARRLAAALGYVGIGSLDRVGVTTFAAGLGGDKSASGGAKSTSGGDKSASGGALAPRRGRMQLFHLLEYMSGLRASGGTDIAKSLQDYARRSRSPGLAIVISDLLDDSLDGYRRGLRALLFHDFEVVLVHVLDRGEIGPEELGALRLTDMESGQTVSLSVDRPLLAAYRAKVGGFFGEVESFCLKNRIEYLRTATIVPFEDVVLRYLRQGAHLHAR
ncbi:MAG: DUF58 domain-containing protein [Spirochaetia bacterium]|jgi:uncharacterized protein (DUF58 family)